MKKSKTKHPTACISEDSSIGKLSQTAERKKVITKQERLRIYDDATLIFEAIAKKKKQKFRLDETLSSTGCIELKEATIDANISWIEYRKGKLLQEALFFRRLFRKKRWRKMRWKFELGDQEIVLWPDAISEGKERCAIRIQMQGVPHAEEEVNKDGIQG